MRTWSQYDIAKFLNKKKVIFSKVKNKSSLIADFESVVLDITVADKCRIWMYNEKKKSFISENLKLSRKNYSNLVIQSYNTKTRLIINSVNDKAIYQGSLHENDMESIKDVMIYPIIGEDNKIIAIVQLSIYQNVFYQFIKDDFLYLDLFAEFFIRCFKDDKIVLEDMEEILQLKIKELQESNNNQATSLELNAKYFEDIIVELHDPLNRVLGNKRVAELRDTTIKSKKKIESKNRYFAEMVHELRTPLNAILGFAELLKSDEKNNEKIDYLSTILSGGDGMLEIINDILDSSKADNENIEYSEFSPIDEFELIANLFTSRMHKKHIDFNIFIDPLLPSMIKADKRKIKQILTNIIGNAVKFTPYNGSINLNILHEQKSNKISFSVKDSGIGIDKDRQDAIFNPFEQESENTSNEFGGTGLGLNISQKFVSILGGELKVNSKKGEGAEFYFSLDCIQLESSLNHILDIKDIKKIKLGFFISKNYNNSLKLLQRYLDRLNISNIEVYSNADNISKDIDSLICSIDNFENLNIKSFDLNKTNIILFRKNFLDNIEIYDKNITLLTLPLSIKKFYNSILKKNSISKINKIKQVKKLVAVVDDNDLNVKYLKLILERLGATVIVGYDGEDAIKLFNNTKEKIDIFFIDEFMQKMNGTEAVQQIISLSKKLNQTPPPFVGISGSNTIDEIQRMRENGFDHIMSKPFSNKTIQKHYYNL